MTRVIYKVTSKKIAEMLDKERIRRDKFIPSVLRKVKKILPQVAHVSYSDNIWHGTRDPRSLVFKDDFIIDNTWIRTGEVFAKKAWRKTYWPKRNTKAGRELSKKLSKVMRSEKFFQSEELLGVLNYNPKENIITKKDRMVTTNIAIGYAKKKNGDFIYCFSAYDGYKPPRGVKEMMMSEYNKIFGE